VLRWQAEPGGDEWSGADKGIGSHGCQGGARLVNRWPAQKAQARKEAAPWEATMDEQQHQDENAASNEMITRREAWQSQTRFLEREKRGSVHSPFNKSDYTTNVDHERRDTAGTQSLALPQDRWLL
jgi:hypothetical protein